MHQLQHQVYGMAATIPVVTSFCNLTETQEFSGDLMDGSDISYISYAESVCARIVTIPQQRRCHFVSDCNGNGPMHLLEPVRLRLLAINRFRSDPIYGVSDAEPSYLSWCINTLKVLIYTSWTVSLSISLQCHFTVFPYKPVQVLSIQLSTKYQIGC